MSLYATFRSSTGIYHIVLSQTSIEHDRTLCRKDLSTYETLQNM
jgi:hypothetical protein